MYCKYMLIKKFLKTEIYMKEARNSNKIFSLLTSGNIKANYFFSGENILQIYKSNTVQL